MYLAQRTYGPAGEIGGCSSSKVMYGEQSLYAGKEQYSGQDVRTIAPMGRGISQPLLNPDYINTA